MHHLAAVFTGRGPDVDHPVGVGDGVLVVLDNDECIAQIPKARKGFNESPVVALVQSDRRLVKHVEHPGQPGADLGCQPDALGLAAGQRARRPAQ